MNSIETMAGNLQNVKEKKYVYSFSEWFKAVKSLIKIRIEKP